MDTACVCSEFSSNAFRESSGRCHKILACYDRHAVPPAQNMVLCRPGLCSRCSQVPRRDATTEPGKQLIPTQQLPSSTAFADLQMGSLCGVGATSAVSRWAVPAWVESFCFAAGLHELTSDACKQQCTLVCNQVLFIELPGCALFDLSLACCACRRPCQCRVLILEHGLRARQLACSVGNRSCLLQMNYPVLVHRNGGPLSKSGVIAGTPPSPCTSEANPALLRSAAPSTHAHHSHSFGPRLLWR